MQLTDGLLRRSANRSDLSGQPSAVGAESPPGGREFRLSHGASASRDLLFPCRRREVWRWFITHSPPPAAAVARLCWGCFMRLAACYHRFAGAVNALAPAHLEAFSGRCPMSGRERAARSRSVGHRPRPDPDWPGGRHPRAAHPGIHHFSSAEPGANSSCRSTTSSDGF